MRGKLWTITNRSERLIAFKDFIRNWIKFEEDDLRICRDYNDWHSVSMHVARLSVLKVILKKTEMIV
ncbi:MAG: hypothetical protein ACE5H1_01225 [Thermodesulfobacteriota bacterium]